MYLYKEEGDSTKNRESELRGRTLVERTTSSSIQTSSRHGYSERRMVDWNDGGSTDDGAQMTGWKRECVDGGKCERRSRKVPFVEYMNLLGEERPAELSALALFNLAFLFSSASSGKFDLPAAKVVQKTHIGLNQDTQSA